MLVTHLGQTRQINQSEVQDVRAVYPQRDRQFANTLILPGHPIRFLFNLFPNLIEVGETPVNVEKLSPFRVRRCIG